MANTINTSNYINGTYFFKSSYINTIFLYHNHVFFLPSNFYRTPLLHRPEKSLLKFLSFIRIIHILFNQMTSISDNYINMAMDNPPGKGENISEYKLS